jgi:hypothetical protein
LRVRKAEKHATPVLAKAFAGVLGEGHQQRVGLSAAARAVHKRLKNWAGK